MSKENGGELTVDFIKIAWEKILEGEIDDAMGILRSIERESESNADYHVVLASALLTQKRYVAARDAAESALTLMPDSAHARLISTIASERLPALWETAIPLVVDDDSQLAETLASMLDPLPASTTDASRTAELRFDLDKTADELTRERPLVKAIPEVDDSQPSSPTSDSGAPMLVSETLAEIMINQGKLGEAKKVYIQLSRQKPDRYSHFAAKIEAIDKLLLGTSIAPETTPDADPV